MCLAALVLSVALVPCTGVAQDAPNADARSKVDLGTRVDRSVQLTLGKGRAFRFEEPVDTALVGDPKIADVHVISPRLIYVFANGVGSTNLVAIGAGDRQIAAIDLRVTRDPGSAESTLQTLHPNSAVTLAFAGDRLVVRGEAQDVGGAMDAAIAARSGVPDDKDVVDRATIDKATQINLRVRFAEVSRTSIRNLGVNWQALLRPGAFTLGLTSGSFLQGGVDTSSTFGTITGGLVTSRANVDVLLDALQREQALTMLAEPNLTTVSGQTASFLAGGEVPIPVPQSDRTITLDYKQFGVSLAFTPTVLEHDRIGIRVKPEVSTIVQNSPIVLNGVSAPTFSVRRAETTVELASGDTFAIAGLLQHNISDDLDKLPGLGALPVLGPLFRSSKYERDESELVILITPYLVKPSPDRSLTAPTDRIGADTASGPAAIGLAGFIID
ncbi:type II and III secretion system protein RhcC2 [Aliidongia dinghuensis]|uniref:Type II and III secretion system protein RhcC2 n=1 Tax=Aliidongia dinghuensis TaxID=1867774 RepID=A0A8J3E1Z2_9PROT|nr:type II and III secretion system protein RhcC2 [Aliidongia dinghuensis]